ncbi:MAG TPA: O-antigen ligase family protein [Solirubrobacterales bacterium]|nr:O-antigen ligase family protein [Solirubrobacterales bacterium]
MSDVLASLGVLAAAGSAATAILLPAGRLRAAAMLAALVLFPVLVLGDQWDSRQIVDLRDGTFRFASFGYLAVVATLLLAAIFDRWPFAMPLAIVAALPFRIPLESGGDTANLLVPLYLVIAGGVLATAFRDLGFSREARPAGPVAAGDPPPLPVAKASSGAGPPTAPPAERAAYWLPRVLAAVVVLYALQTLYSPDFSKSLQNVCFFFVPFSLVYALLRDVRWDRELLAWVLGIVAIEAVLFVAVGSVEYVTRELFWNDLVIRSNEFHTYFRVNSVFWDPNIYGRYLALVAVLAMAVLLWARERRSFVLLTVLIAVLWIGLVPTFSQSSFAALLGGLAVLAALKWSAKWTLVAVGAGAILAVSIVVFAGGVSKLSPDRCNVDTGGRCNLVAGGAKLFGQRPLWGYGSGSFPKAYRQHIDTDNAPVSVSHTEPITVAAEQGLVGFAAYVALIVVALWTMARGLAWNASPAGGAVGGTAPEEALATGGGGGSPAATGPAGHVARAPVLAAFVALLVHTMAYAGFYEDPITWVLLAVGASLACAPAVRDAA